MGREGISTRRTASEDDRDEYLDPYTKELMSDPVKCTDGRTYDRFSVFQYNQAHNTPLVIACDDLNVRSRLFQKFANEGLESKSRSLRKAYRDQALEVANKGHSSEALAMLKNVLQWAPNDRQCLLKSEEIVAEQSQRAAVQPSAPPHHVVMPPPERTTMQPNVPTYHQSSYSHPYPNEGNRQTSQQKTSQPQNAESLAVGIIIMVLCFPCSLCCIPCLFPNACGD